MLRWTLLRLALSQEDLPILHSAPFTGGGWDYGHTMNYAFKMMVDEINANPNILPNHNLVWTAVDDQCRADTTSALALDLLFNKKAEEVVQDFDTGNGLTFTKQPATDIEFVGLIGPACSPGIPVSEELWSMGKKPLISASAASAGLADRTAYPNFWRSSASDGPNIAGLAFVAEQLGFTEVALIVHHSMVTNAPTFVDAVSQTDMQLVAPHIMKDKYESSDIDAPGYLMEEDGYDAAYAIISDFKKQPARYFLLLGCELSLHNNWKRDAFMYYM